MIIPGDQTNSNIVHPNWVWWLVSKVVQVPLTVTDPISSVNTAQMYHNIATIMP